MVLTKLDRQTLPFRGSHWNRLESHSVELVRALICIPSTCWDFVCTKSASVPPNVQFQIDDAESEWTFGEGVFDLVHIRHLDVGIQDWGKLIKEAYK